MTRPNPRALIAALAALVLAVQAAITYYVAARARTVAIDEIIGIFTTSTTTTQGALNAALLRVDALLSALPDTLHDLDGGWLDSLPSARFLRNQAAQNLLLRDLLVVSADGRVLAAGLPATKARPPQLDAEFLSAILDETHQHLHFSHPFRNPGTGQWSILLGRAGRLAGIGRVALLGEVQVTALAELFATAPSLPGLKIEVLDGHGGLISANPHDERRMVAHASAAPRQLDVTIDTIATAISWLGRARPGVIAGSTYKLVYRDLTLVGALELAPATAALNQEITRTYVFSALFSLVWISSVVIITALQQMRHRARLQISQIAVTLERALDAMHDGLALYDAKDCIVLVNRRYIEIFPYLHDIARPGTSFHTIARFAACKVLPADAPDQAIEEWASERVKMHLADQGPFEQVTPDGRRMSVIERRTQEGGVIAIYRDVTKERSDAQEMALARERAEEANRSKSRFLANMSHELRTPLNAIIGFTDLMRSMPTPLTAAKTNEYLGDIHASGLHLLSLINDLLDLARIEEGKFSLDLRALQGRAEIRAAVQTVRAQIQDKRLSLRLAIQPGLPDIWADQRAVQQILLNLLANAQRYAAKGGHRIVVRAALGRPGFVRLSVWDNGPGIPGGQINKLGKPFAQIETTRYSKDQGTGLGLAISRRLTEAMGGTLTIESRERAWTQVSIDLPVAT